MRKILFLSSLVFVLLISNLTFAKSTAVPFLSINPGARPAGMGEAFSAIADDATATYWNPAGLAFIKQRQVALMHSPWLPELSMDLYYEFAAYTMSVPDWGNFGISLTYFNMGEWERMDAEGNPEGTDKSYDGAMGLSYATKFQENWGLGLNFKFIYSHLAEEGVSGEGKGIGVSYAIDLGTLYKFGGVLEGLSAALVLQNLGPKIAYIDEEQADPLPRNLRIGLAYKVFNPIIRTELQKLHDLTLTFEFSKILIDTNDYPLFWSRNEGKQSGVESRTELSESVVNIGAEYWFAKILGLRVGYMRNAEGFGGNNGESYIKGLTYGAGLKYDFATYGLEFDFGMIPGGDLSDHNKKFSLTAYF